MKIKSKSKIEIQEIFSSLQLNDVGICLRDGPFTIDLRFVNLNPTKGTPWVAYIGKNYFESNGSPPPKKNPKDLIINDGKSICSENQIQ